MAFSRELLESQREKRPVVTLLISVRVGTLSSLLAAALLCILPYRALLSGHLYVRDLA